MYFSVIKIDQPLRLERTLWFYFEEEVQVEDQKKKKKKKKMGKFK